MSTSDQDKSQPQEDRRKEEQEDASSYYAQGDAKSGYDAEAEFAKPVPLVEKSQEEMSMLKVVAYLGFGLAALAIVFILFFIRDLDHRVGGMGTAVSSLEEIIAPLKKEMNDTFTKVNEDISGLKAKVGDTERRVAVSELKRALIAVQGMGLDKNSEAKAKSDQVIASIQSLLGDFGSGEAEPNAAPTSTQPAGVVKVEEAPEIELPVVEEAVEEHAPVAEEHTDEATPEPMAEAEHTPEVEEPTEEASSDEGEGETGSDGEDEDEEDE
jgi:hypothetical protein